MAGSMRFTTVVEARGRSGAVRIRLPEDPDLFWGAKGRHDVNGTIGGHGVRGPIGRTDAGEAVLDLGPSWCRDPSVGAGRTVQVMLTPEEPQLDTMAPDIAAAIVGDTAARRTFESLASHYRKNYVRWIEEAKKPETRTNRIAETVEALRAGRRER